MRTLQFQVLRLDIEPLSDSEIQNLTDTLNEIEIVRYLYKKESSQTPPRIGMIAEEMPEVLATEDRRGMDLGRHVGFLMGVVKALKAENDKNSEMIEELRSEIESLKASR